MPGCFRLGDADDGGNSCNEEVCTTIAGSGNVYVNGLNQQRVGDPLASDCCDTECCSPPDGEPDEGVNDSKCYDGTTCAQGSSTVLANSLPMTRIGDKMSNGNTAVDGSGNVFAGGPQAGGEDDEGNAKNYASLGCSEAGMSGSSITDETVSFPDTSLDEMQSVIDDANSDYTPCTMTVFNGTPVTSSPPPDIYNTDVQPQVQPIEEKNTSPLLNYLKNSLVVPNKTKTLKETINRTFIVKPDTYDMVHTSQSDNTISFNVELRTKVVSGTVLTLYDNEIPILSRLITQGDIDNGSVLLTIKLLQSGTHTLVSTLTTDKIDYGTSPVITINIR